MRIPSAAAPSLCRDPLVTVGGEVGKQLARGIVDDHGSNGERHDDVQPVAPMSIAAFAWGSVLRLVLLPVPQVEQCGEAVRRDKGDAAAVAAVPAIRSAARNILFATEAADAVSASARFHKDSDVIDKGRHKGWNLAELKEQ